MPYFLNFYLLRSNKEETNKVIHKNNNNWSPIPEKTIYTFITQVLILSREMSDDGLQNIFM